MKEKLSKNYFAKFFRGVLQGAWKEVHGAVNVPLLILSKNHVFLLDSNRKVSDFFSEFKALTQGSSSWNLNTEIREYHQDTEEMECYFVDVRLRGEGDFKKANMSAKLYVRRSGTAPRVELIEFV